MLYCAHLVRRRWADRGDFAPSSRIERAHHLSKRSRSGTGSRNIGRAEFIASDFESSCIAHLCVCLPECSRRSEASAFAR